MDYMLFRTGFAVCFALSVSRRVHSDWWSYMALMYDSGAKFENADAIQFRKIKPVTSQRRVRMYSFVYMQ